ncbi:MAG: hypothetical protein IJY58_00230 [Alphaproteobacteria bacterium]|nr:hypothetical protein [Alphaproteobacteria bacterium]
MTNSILSLYRVFFTDENHQLWAVMRDGRVVFMKNIPPFATFSSDRTILTGVEIDGKQTHFNWVFANFQKQVYPPIMSQNGYCYYPALWNTPHALFAFLRADLLNPKGTGDLLIYRKARTKYHLIDEMTCAMIPPHFGLSGALYYIDIHSCLTKRIMGVDEALYPKVSHFALNPTEQEYAVYCEETIRLIDFKIGLLRQVIAFDVTALGFDETGQYLFFATHKHGRTGLYQYDRQGQEITLVLNHSAKITALSY